MQLGLPLGLVLAYFTIGLIAQAFGSWRAPFLFAGVPGLLLALCFFFVREPGRGAAEVGPIALAGPGDRPFRRIFAVPTVWWIVFAGVGSNRASYSVNTFTVPLFQRWFGPWLTSAAALTGVVVGLTGLVGLTAGGWLADRAGHRSPMARVLVGAVAMLVAAPLAPVALGLGRDAVGGLHSAMAAVVPITLVVAAIGLFGAAWTIRRDAARMQQELAGV